MHFVFIRLAPVLLACTCAAVCAAPARADEPPPADDWSLELVPTTPGGPIFYQLAWHNRAASAVRVPSDLLGSPVLSVSHCPPSGCRWPRAGVGFVQARRTPARADAVAWTRVEPGASVEASGDLTVAAPAQCTPKGCAVGTYTVTARVGQRSFVGLEDDQQAPFDTVTKTLTVVAATIAVESPTAVSVAAVFSRRPAAIHVLATITNQLSVPLWFPGKGALFAECPTTVVGSDGMIGMGDMRSAAGGQSSYDETDAVLLPPGGSARLVFDCPFDYPAGARHVDARLRLVPFRPFEPSRATSPFHFTATALSPAGRVF